MPTPKLFDKGWMIEQMKAKTFFAMAAPVKLEAAQDEEKKLRKFQMEAYNGGAMRFAWSSRPVVVDLAGMEITDKPRPIFRDHDSSRVVGHTEAIKNTGKVLRLSGVASASNDVAREVVDSADNGFPWQASIGAEIIKMESVDTGKVKVNGQSFQAPINIVRASRLSEVSFVALGADDSTSARMTAGRVITKESPMDFQTWLIARGLDLAKLNDADKAKLQAEFDAAQTTPTDDSDAVIKAQREKSAIEAERIAAINEVCSSHPKIQAQAIREGWSKDKAELEVLRASRPQAPAINTGAGQVGLTAEVMTAGLIQATRGKTDGIDAKVLEAADKRWKGRLGLQQMLLEAAWANGYHGNNFDADRRGVLEAAFSVNDIAGVLSTVANKALLAGYMGVDMAWRAIAGIRPVSDFKTVTSYRLTGANQYEKVAPTGEIKHGTLAELSYTNKADTYGLMLGISRRDLINDDLGALSNVPTMIGRGAAIKLNEVFWTAFMDNASFFTSGNGNYIDGATTVLSIEGLRQADQKFLDQTDADGKPLGVNASILLVPSSLKVTALQMMNSTELATSEALSSGGAKFGTSNPFAGAYRPVATPYLNNTTFTGYSATAWYLLANPMDIATIEVAFLNGVEVPTVETADADFNTLGINMRGYHDFGVTKQDFRGGVKSKGAA